MASAGVVALKLVVNLCGSVQRLFEEVRSDQGRGTVHLVEVLDLLGNVDVSVGGVELLSDELIAEYGSQLLGGHRLVSSRIEQRRGLVLHIRAYVVPFGGNFAFVKVCLVGDFVFFPFGFLLYIGF